MMTIATTKTTTVAYRLTAAALLLTLGGCEREEIPPEPAASVPPPEPTSIMRDDLDDTVLPPEPQPTPLTARIAFAENDTELSLSAKGELASILRSPQIAEGGPIILGGHSDSAGGDAANLRSSRQRGEAVRDYLVENGVDEQRIKIIAFGEQNPLQPNALPDGNPNAPGRSANRRVELLIALPGSNKSAPDELTANDREMNTDPD